MTKAHHLTIGSLILGNDLPFVLIAGPCQIESREHALKTAIELKNMCTREGVGFIYKTSFDKANRTSINCKRGIGLTQSMSIFSEISKNLGILVLTDVHTVEQCAKVATVVDVLQIPAFLCRQTDLLLAAGATGLAINVKKGQFLAPWDMSQVVEKIESTGNNRIMLCERGVSFGYNNLITDMRSLPIMAKTGCPIVFDATHSVQQPGGQISSSGGQSEFASVLARAAVSVGVAAIFVETHENPKFAPSDGFNMIPLSEMPNFISTLVSFDRLAKTRPIFIS
ncbi:MAG: 3-deoxy-8-phosphooctulonate synthase [Rhodospirillaceae bacterium]|jgi:2-dehydro-3-deoxyphosphooctonate aldolase (KDO 8-P synthase)|nr:3-deoxy-8-phosphooctulonate synthase [Rhodospirillaceae bacterium]